MTTDIKELKRLASSAELGCLSHGNKRSFAELDAFHVAAHPSAVLDLIAKIEQQQIEIDTLRHGLRLANDARSDLEAKLSAQTAKPAVEDMPVAAVGMGAPTRVMTYDKSGSALHDVPARPEVMMYKHLPQGTLLYTHPAKTEQPSLSDAEISNLILEAESGMPYSPRLQAVPLTTVIALVRRILAQRQDSDKDAARYRFMREDTRVGIEIEGRELSHEYLDEAIDRAIANGAPK